MVLALLVGKFTGNPDGVTNDDVSMKKINSKKIRSVMEAMLNAASTLFRDCRFIVSYEMPGSGIFHKKITAVLVAGR